MSSNMLSDAEVKKAKTKDQPYHLQDGRGLFLYVSHTGSKLWRHRYTHGGTRKTQTLGEYPAMTLSDARLARENARQHLRDGNDPAEVKRTARLQDAQDTFEVIAREWHDLNKSGWSKTHARDVLESLETHIFPFLGSRPIRSITPPLVIEQLRKIERRPAVETAHRVRQRMSQVFVFAIATGRGENDPATVVRPAMATLVKRRMPAVTTLEDARQILTQAEAIPAHPVTKLALRFLALTVVRPGTLAETPWTECNNLDGKEPVWRIPAARMKLKVQFKNDENRDHLVPLSPQAMDVLAALRTVTGLGTYLFPNNRYFLRPMSENALGYLLNRAGYYQRHVPHGWRATFSTIMNELRPHHRPVIDLMLSHVPENKVEAAYNRAAHLTLRREIAQHWANILLEGMQPAADLLKGPRK